MVSISFLIGLAMIGIVAGFASGLLGVGGGFLMVPLQYFLLTSSGVNPDLAMMVSLGTSLAIIIPTASSGAYEHQKKNRDIVRPGMLLGVFGIFGSFCGGLLANVVPSDILRFIFGILLFIVAVDMLVGFKREGNGTRVPFTKFTAMAFGISIGLISGLLGVGGGVFAVPLLSILFGFTLREAIGTSSIFIAITAIGGVISYIISGYGVNPIPYSLGYVSLVNWFAILVFSVPMARIGAKSAYKLPEKRLKQVFAVILFYMGIKMMGFDPIMFLVGLMI
jgi:uncharacterized membrane protein YfcA